MDTGSHCAWNRTGRDGEGGPRLDPKLTCRADRARDFDDSKVFRLMRPSPKCLTTHTGNNDESGQPRLNRSRLSRKDHLVVARASRVTAGAGAPEISVTGKATESGHRQGYHRPMEPDVRQPASGEALDWEASPPSEVRALADELTPLFYADLKRIAHRERSRVGAGATLQTTALVNEAYLKLRGSKSWTTDAHFIRAAALAMRHALVNHAVARLAGKRGSGAQHVSLAADMDVAVEDDATVVALNDALGRLAVESLRLAQVVECRYFAGYDEPETALALGISERTVRRDWTLARAWLHRDLAEPR